MEEVFRGVQGYEGYYEVSNLGRVRSTSYKGTVYLKPTKMKNGYLNVILCVNQKRVHRNIHRLVAETFLQNPLNLETVNHKDGNKDNNIVSNLEWLSSEDNIRYSNKNMLTKELVLEIPKLIEKRLQSDGYSQLFSSFQKNNSMDFTR